MTYDAEAAVLGIWLPGASRDARTRELAPGIHVDLTPEGRLTSVVGARRPAGRDGTCGGGRVLQELTAA